MAWREIRGDRLELGPGLERALLPAATTVTNLLLFLDPEQGRVEVDGRDARDLRQADVRAVFALAGQDAHVFEETIRANLLVARPEATEAELHAVLVRTRLDAWVASLPDGLDTLVGEDGSRLSAASGSGSPPPGALLADAPILILDEPTAHLDGPTAEALVRDVLAAAEDRTVLLITHRPEGLDLVEEVVRLDGCVGGEHTRRPQGRAL